MDSVASDIVVHRIAFVMSHPFQYLYYKDIVSITDDPIIVLETRKNTPFTFSDEFVAQLPGQVIRLDQSELDALDGLVDAIFCMTPKHLMALFRKTKTIALQYSMAKEIYQYGPWRCIADLNLMQGQYSHDKVSGFCVSEIVGNPRYDGFVPAQTGGGGLLYMPTYGELSSLNLFIDALPFLPRDLTIKVKLHHGSEFSDTGAVDRLRSDPRVEIIDGYTNPLADIAAADVVLSDYSGAIFDALYFDRPVCLIQAPLVQTIVRTGKESIEIARGADIGPVARSSEEIPYVVQQALDNPGQWDEGRKALSKEIYSYHGQSAERIKAVLQEFLAGSYRPDMIRKNLHDTYMRDVDENRTLRRQLAIARQLKSKKSGKKRGAVQTNVRHLKKMLYPYLGPGYKLLKQRLTTR